MAQKTTYKIVLIGDGGVGKSAYVKRLLTGEFEKRYLATLGVEVTPYADPANCDPQDCLIGDPDITISFWDCAGQAKFAGLDSGYYLGADMAFCFYDATSKITYKNMGKWIRKFKKERPNAPVLLVHNKVDVKEPKVNNKDFEKAVEQYKTKGVQISVKSNFNLEKPVKFALEYLRERDQKGTLNFKF